MSRLFPGHCPGLICYGPYGAKSRKRNFKAGKAGTSQGFGIPPWLDLHSCRSSANVIRSLLGNKRLLSDEVFFNGRGDTTHPKDSRVGR